MIVENYIYPDLKPNAVGSLERTTNRVMRVVVAAYFIVQTIEPGRMIFLFRGSTWVFLMVMISLIVMRNGFRDSSPMLGLILVKAGMIMSRPQNPVAFTLLILQLYSLAQINKTGVQDTNTWFSNKIFVYTALFVTTQQYFYHSGKFEKLFLMNLERMCGWECPPMIGLPMSIFELAVQLIVTLCLVPYVVDQQVYKAQEK